MKILITGNMGYVGPGVVSRLKKSHPQATLLGLDLGYFSTCLSGTDVLPECRVHVQHFGDVRKVQPSLLTEVDAVVYLAAISNDPMSATFEDITFDVNYRAAINIARMAKAAGTSAFVFASSCSVYGFAEGGPRAEEDALNPLTPYAKSKVMAEQELAPLADRNFRVTCLRFATACGMSERLRLDLVLNDFVASALSAGKITILSDGTPWRPLIHVKDMARAIDWAVQREHANGGAFLSLNVGSDVWNYQVRDLAQAVARIIPGTQVDVNANAQPDKRSYQVSFAKFSKLAQGFLPEIDLTTAIGTLKSGLESMEFKDKEFRSSSFIRLNVLKSLQQRGLLNTNMEWVEGHR